MTRFSSWLDTLRRRLKPRPVGRRPRLRPSVEALEGRDVPTTFFVLNTSDAGDGSMRQAILNTNANPGPDQISFIGATGPLIINLQSPLPTITEAVLIDGYTHPGALPNSLAVGSDAVFAVTMLGVNAGQGANGLNIQGGGTTVRGLQLVGFVDDDEGNGGNGIVLLAGAENAGNAIEGNNIFGNLGSSVVIGVGAGNNRVGGLAPAQRNRISNNGDDGILVFGNANVIQNNYIGTDAQGAAVNGNSDAGINIQGDANLVGGADPAARNVISGNNIGFQVQAATGNRLQNNFVGTDATGIRALGNGDGVLLFDDAADTLVTNNLISGNRFDGLDIFEARGTVVRGNLIGTDATGLLVLGNGDKGVVVSDGSTGNVIGGPAAADRNVISGNGSDGVKIAGADAANNTVEGNFIGTDLTGAAALASQQVNGVLITGQAHHNLVLGNVIANSIDDGVEIDEGASNNTIKENRIGTNAAGNAALGNRFGVFVQDAADNVLIDNVISGNLEHGVIVAEAGATGTVIQGNLIGLALNGVDVLGNGDNGIEIDNGASGTLIGGGTLAQRNLISGNGGRGVELEAGTGPTRILVNHIGTDAAGRLDLGNLGDGVLIQSADNEVGGNLISGNGGDGVEIDGARATRNLIRSNFIGTDGTGTNFLGNGDEGIGVESGAADNLILDNLVSGNLADGIEITTFAARNVVRGNRVGTDVTGTRPLGNVGDGVEIDSEASDNTIGGVGAGQGNVIAFNGGNGVVVNDSDSVGNTISGNAIFGNAGLGIDLDGDGPTPNDPLDPDASPNNLQNTPVITTVFAQGNGQTLLAGTINSTPNVALRIELFANAAADDSGFGEGRRFLGYVDVYTDAHGNAAFSYLLAGGLAAGEVVTATATALASGDTSEFSGAQGPTGGTVTGTKYIDLNGNGVIDAGEPGLGGVTIFADLNANHVLDGGDVSTVSAHDGSFTLVIPPNGTFAIREVLPAGFVQTTPDRVVTVADANAVGNVLIGNRPFQQDATPLISVVRGKAVFNPLLRRTRLKVTLKNVSGKPIAGPLSLILDKLNLKLRSKAGLTQVLPPTLSPFVFVDVGGDGVLSPGEEVTVKLTFANLFGLRVKFTPRLVAGDGPR